VEGLWLMNNFDLVIIGGGPAGIAAAATAAKHGLSVALIDERPTLGGQIYKRVGPGFKVKSAKEVGKDYFLGEKLIAELNGSNVNIFLETLVVAIEDSSVVIARNGQSAEKLIYKKLLISPGAYDRPVAFPGWTLPGVITAGAAQSLVKTQRVNPGSRIFFAGSGPLALAFPAQLSGYGANIVGIIEAAPRPGIFKALRILLAIFGNLDLMRDAAKYQFHLISNRIPMNYRRIIVSANGKDRVESVTHARVDKNWRVIPGTEKTVAVDALCVGYGFFPSVELFRLLGCELEYEESRGGAVVKLDNWGATSVANVFGAGDGTGISGSYVAIARGRLAALKIAAELGKISEKSLSTLAAGYQKTFAQRTKFQSAINNAYEIKSGIYELANNETVICRCESVKLESILPVLESTVDPSVVKAYTRCGMGLCQGRNCQRQISALLAKKQNIPISQILQATPRFPTKPISLGQIADSSITSEKYFIDAE
jgi:NADPH-dependent 2,4-dienoyl-CoA reductase/sulfur reductase-like enzyme